MRRSHMLLLLVLMLVASATVPAQSPALGSVKTVYFWPMRHSLDQYLAEQLSVASPFQVVVDPKLADAIVTERIDAPFLKAMDELFPPDEPASKPEAAAASAEAGSGSIEEGLRSARPSNRALAQPEGTVFLVHSASRKVLWSTFVRPKDFAPKNLHEQAKSIAARLKKETAPLE